MGMKSRGLEGLPCQCSDSEGEGESEGQGEREGQREGESEGEGERGRGREWGEATILLQIVPSYKTLSFRVLLWPLGSGVQQELCH